MMRSAHPLSILLISLLAALPLRAQEAVDTAQAARALYGSWELELLSNKPWKEHAIFAKDSADTYTVDFTENRHYRVEIQLPGGVKTMDSGTWELWYLPEGFYGDTLFYAAEGLYLMLHPGGDSNHFPLLGEYPERLVFSDAAHFSLYWECFCGVLALDRGFRRKRTYGSQGEKVGGRTSAGIYTRKCSKLLQQST